MTHPDWNEVSAFLGHEVILDTLPCGKSVVLDPTGIQFGWKEHIAPWPAYHAQRVYHIIEVKDIGPGTPGIQDAAGNESLGRISLMAGVPPENATRNCKEQLVMETVVSSLESQIKTHFGGVTDFLRLKGAEFEAARAAVVAAAQRGLTMLASEVNSSAYSRAVQRVGGGRGIIWVKNGLGNVARKHNEKPQRLWKARWDKVVDITLPMAEAE
ncbi:hypothetical protein C8A01DRAFT_41852 [Parachaetomium inaequale]|uniref:Uncharacterized protein n=1 Tax=Parachaetomium inaequale TaxID=2588326 RepID=A0AAN6SLP4_9PEZI|nr:hypothetical protein C8A01DRAFT_41852 [Parachaetomium inaequale]